MTFNIHNEPLYRLAHAVAPLFSECASFSSPEETGAAGDTRLLISNPFGPETRAITLTFPASVIGVYDTMDIRRQARVHRNVSSITYRRRDEILNRRRDGCATGQPACTISFGDEIFNATR